MVNFVCNSTLGDLRNTDAEVPLFGTTTFHTLGIDLCIGLTAFAVAVSISLIMLHALNYTKPHEQRHIIRILFMIPVYSVASCLSFIFYPYAIYFQVMSDCYEAFAIAAFFSLLCHYIAPNLHDQKNVFRNLAAKEWVWPLNWCKRCLGGKNRLLAAPRSGLTWFNIIWFCIFQYCFIRVSMTIISVITQATGTYCESSDSPTFAHIWVICIETIAVCVAMYCLIQFYWQLRVELKPHSPFLKILSIKLVIFLSFWQSLLISYSISWGWIKPTDTIVYPDLNVGIPSLLICIEMATFSILHLFAFSHRPYQNTMPTQYANAETNPAALESQIALPKQGGRFGTQGLLDAFNPWDLVKAFARGARWVFVGRRTREQDQSYKLRDSNQSFQSRVTEDGLQLTALCSSLPGYTETDTVDRSGSNSGHDDDYFYVSYQ